MRAPNRRSQRLLSLRNLLICILSILVIFFSLDRIFSPSRNYFIKGHSESEVEAQAEENQNVELLQIEQMDKLDFLSGMGENKMHKDIYEAVYSTLTDAQKADLAAGSGRYPLISHMQQDDIYDEDTVHIVVLGDSYTWGEAAINRNEIFWRLLETNLRAQGYNVRVSGVAMINASSFDEFRWLTQTDLMDDLKPDMIVFGYVLNDPEWYNYMEDDEIFEQGIIDPIHLKAEPLLSALDTVLPNLSMRVRNYLDTKVMYTAEGNSLYDNHHNEFQLLAPILKDENLRRFEQDFMAPLDAFAAQRDIPVVLMPMTLFQGERLIEKLFEPLHTLCKTYKNVRLYDTTHDFFHGFDAAKHRNNYYINCANPHPGSSMSYFYARFMETFLKKDFADLLGEPSADVPTRPLSVSDALPGACLLSAEKTDDATLTCKLAYPAPEQTHRIGDLTVRDHLTLPLEKDFVALSFAQPVDLSQIELSGENAEKAEVYYMHINEELQYDDHTVKPFGVQDGAVWTDDTPDRVTMLLIHAETQNGQDADLTLTIHSAEREGS